MPDREIPEHADDDPAVRDRSASHVDAPVGPPQDRTPYVLMIWLLVCFFAGLTLLALSAYFA